VGSLTGMRAFDRTIDLLTEPNPSFKATYTVWGANHNFYNTEWQEPDSSSCFGVGSDEQRQTGFLAMLAFFRANVAATVDANLNQLFDPRFAAPADRVDRGFHPGSNSALSFQLEDFKNPAGTSTFGLPNVASNVTVAHGSVNEHDNTHSAGTISWTTAGTSTHFQTNFAASGSGLSLVAYQFLDLRVDRARDTNLNTATTTDFTVALVNANNTLSSGRLISAHLRLEGPVGPRSTNTHSVLQTARIPLSVFSGANLSSIRGVRLTFNATPTGKIYVANIRATAAGIAGPSAFAFAPATTATTTTAQAPFSALSAGTASAAVPTRVISSGNRILAIRTRDASSIELTLQSPTPIEGHSEPPVLSIGTEETRVSSHPRGNIATIVFRMERQAFDRLRGGEPVVARYGVPGSSLTEWSFGPLDKTRLDK